VVVVGKRYYRWGRERKEHLSKSKKKEKRGK